jgi:hypothetical protein
MGAYTSAASLMVAIVLALKELALLDAGHFPPSIARDETRMNGAEAEFAELKAKCGELLQAMSARSIGAEFSKSREWGFVSRFVIVTPEPGEGWSSPTTLICWRFSDESEVRYLVDDAGPVPPLPQKDPGGSVS